MHGIDLALWAGCPRHSAAMTPPFRPPPFRLPSDLRKRLRLPLLGVALAASLALLAWDRLDTRLAAEATLQAAEGHSLAVATMRADWSASVVPTAMSADGAAGADARRVAQVRVDLAIARARRGDTRPLVQLATAMLHEILGLQPVATDAGAEWAEWLTPRLIEAAETLDAKRRIQLLALADQTLARLAVRPRRREAIAAAEPTRPPPPEPLPEPPAEASLAESAPAEAAAEPPAAQSAEPIAPPESPQRIVVVGPSEPREPAGWSPRWSAEASTPIKPSTTPASIAINRADDAASRREADLRLLAEFVELAAQAPAMTDAAYARGPKSLPLPTDRWNGPRRTRFETVRAELAERGYQSITAEQVAALLSDDFGERRRLAERLPTVRSGDAARLLLLLAQDPSAVVRQAAVSALGSSSSRALVEAACELATNDRDPRVGRLAQPLRERLR